MSKSQEVKIFQGGEGIEEGSLLVASKFSVEGRTGTKLTVVKPSEHPVSEYQARCDLEWLIRKGDLPDKIIRQMLSIAEASHGNYTDNSKVIA